MATKYQVFVSSTYEDLHVERDRVIQGILELGHIPVGMEMFSAADEAQWQIIARHIEESDYYVVIIAHRYGSMDGAISFTRKEYEHAIAHGIPTIGFVIEPAAPWPTDRVDTNGPKVDLLKDFKQLVQQKPVGYWANADDLYGQASVALVKTINAQRRVGWVRASSAVGPEVTAEISRLSAENATLRAKIAELEEQREREASTELTELWTQMRSREWKYSARFDDEDGWYAAKPLTYSKVFMVLAPNMVVEATTRFVDDLCLLHTKKADSDDSVGATAIPVNVRNALLADFMMLGLVEPSGRRHPVADRAEYWSLSERGRELLKVRQKAAFGTGRDDSPVHDVDQDSPV